MGSSSNLNKQRRSGDNLYVYHLKMGNDGGDANQPRWTEKVLSFGHCQFTQHHSYSNGRERIYGDPPPWLKGAVNGTEGVKVTRF